MADGQPEDTAAQKQRDDVYSQRSNPAFEGVLEWRTAARDAAFFMPLLRAGMRVMDVGCGPGTITVALAEVVAPGRVDGFDLQPAMVKRARAIASEQRVQNVSFSVANVYKLPFSARTFDAVFANAVLMFVSNPLAALTEIRRVLRPGGVVGLRDPDLGGKFLVPTTPLLQQWLDLRIRVRKHDGGDTFRGRYHRGLLLQAGFARARAIASVSTAGSAEETRRAASFEKAQLDGRSRTALAGGRPAQNHAAAIGPRIVTSEHRP